MLHGQQRQEGYEQGRLLFDFLLAYSFIHSVIAAPEQSFAQVSVFSCASHIEI